MRHPKRIKVSPKVRRIMWDIEDAKKDKSRTNTETPAVDFCPRCNAAKGKEGVMYEPAGDREGQYYCDNCGWAIHADTGKIVDTCSICSNNDGGFCDYSDNGTCTGTEHFKMHVFGGGE